MWGLAPARRLAILAFSRAIFCSFRSLLMVSEPRRGVVARLAVPTRWEEVWEPAWERGPAEISEIFESRCAFSRSITRVRSRLCIAGALLPFFARAAAAPLPLGLPSGGSSYSAGKGGDDECCRCRSYCCCRCCCALTSSSILRSLSFRARACAADSRVSKRHIQGHVWPFVAPASGRTLLPHSMHCIPPSYRLRCLVVCRSFVRVGTPREHELLQSQTKKQLFL